MCIVMAIAKAKSLRFGVEGVTQCHDTHLRPLENLFRIAWLLGATLSFPDSSKDRL